MRCTSESYPHRPAPPLSPIGEPPAEVRHSRAGSRGCRLMTTPHPDGTCLRGDATTKTADAPPDRAVITLGWAGRRGRGRRSGRGRGGRGRGPSWTELDHAGRGRSGQRSGRKAGVERGVYRPCLTRVHLSSSVQFCPVWSTPGVHRPPRPLSPGEVCGTTDGENCRDSADLGSSHKPSSAADHPWFGLLAA